MLCQLGQGIGPVAAVDEVEIGVSRVIGYGPPVLCVAHAVDDGAITAGRLAETTPMIPIRQGSKFAVDEGNEFPGQVVGVAADGARVDVLVAAEAGEAVGKDHDRRAHAPFVHSDRSSLSGRFSAKFSQLVCDQPEPV